MNKLAVAGLTVLIAASGCGHMSDVVIAQKPDRKFTGPKTLVFLDSGNAEDTDGMGPVADQFGDQLRRKGFQVKRFAKGDGSIPFGLELRGDIDDTCSEGGFQFDWLEVSLVDLVRNEKVMRLRGEGESDLCVHLGKHGTLFSDMADAILSNWENDPGSPAPDPNAAPGAK